MRDMIKIYRDSDIDFGSVFDRSETQADVSGDVSRIIRDVRENGDEALIRYCEKFDGARISQIEVSAERIDEAFERVDKKFIDVMRRAAENIRKFHLRQVRAGFMISDGPGVVMGQRVLPIEKVGLYVPGGTAALPSSLLMNCIPAKIAGCSQICVITPPTGGEVSDVILAAARIAGADRVFRSGGAQAIAALAYGTQSVPAVDKIVGPGNAYVAEAKRQVYGRVAIDMIAGPSEILIVADGTCAAEYVAADMLSQAEHDRRASAVLVTDSAELAEAVSEQLRLQLQRLPRREIAEASLQANGKIIVVEDIARAVDIANRIAPEHLELCVDDPFALLGAVKNAGSVFLGKNCPEALGDYFAGTNHVLPTSGTARFFSPLSVDDFVKKYQYTYYTEEALSQVADDIEYFAEREGLSGHARSVAVRREGKGGRA